ncbi:hypothetical protein AZE42_07990 [Rhizopogon vesiculosus]|uniref:REJ domain-containing protein n=1 Tax=Rhizopogon vesiculosus TaxID=180088 RepID=A0A1J8R600_9AGAM|nr:hypothetical protein AZE42_07990 [Rhizopogon vesiculosus]
MSLSIPTSPSTTTSTGSSAIAAATTSTTPTTTSTSSTPSSSSSSTSAVSTPATTSASSSTPTTSSTASSSNPTTQSSSSPLTDSISTTSSTSTTPTPTPITVTSGNVVITTYVTTPASVSSTATSTPAATSNSFFQNTGAVAGVFTVVGLVVLVVFIALVTNAVRRRRAQKFDRDVAEAAAEAAASSRSPFDDYTSGGNGGYPYSDTTHGTFGQAPMSLPNDTYGMSEMSQYDPYAAGAASLASGATVGRARSRQDSETRAPGIAGVGAGNLAREPSRRTPYNAFAGPGPQPRETMDHTPSMRYRRGAEMLEAAGLAGNGAAAVAPANGGAYINRRPSQFTQQTHGSMRSQGHPSNENYPQPLQPGYQPPARNDTQFADPYTGISNTPYPQRLPSPGPAFPISHDPSPSPPSHSQNHLIEGEDFHSDTPPAQLHEDERISYADEDDYGQHNRVLRVANE